MGMHLDAGANARSTYLGSKTAAWSVLALTCLLMIFDFVDRQIVVSMLPFIKADWNLSDTQLGGLISVVSFTVGLFSVPIAILADRWSRVKCIFAMAVIWSLATVACMFASDYWQLLALRGLVGFGEAGYGAVGSALLASIFPSRLRTTVLAMFTACAAIGAVLGVLLGGILSKQLGWHNAFGVVGAPGLLLALLYLFVRDYKTVDLVSPDPKAGQSRASIADILRLLGNAPSGLLVYVGGALQLFVVSTVYSWLPSFFNRAYGLPADQAGVRAAAVLMAGSLSAILWGVVADRVGREHPHRKIWIMIASCLSSFAALTVAFGVLPPGPQQFAMIVAGAILMTGTIGAVGAIAVDVVHPGLRSTALAIGALMQNLLGLAAGPFVTGALSDKYGLATALAVVPCFGLFAAVALFMTISRYKGDLRAVTMGSAGSPIGATT